MTTRPDTKAIREAFGIDVPVRDYETRSQLALRSLCDEIDRLRSGLSDALRIARTDDGDYCAADNVRLSELDALVKP